ncbi:MAG: SagB/ThcOx family dehydrogenase [Muribaculaceae bacterium]|nr:SagB/ThcOx family dehydrogenase [Muribaculaceae bacterium]
MRKTILSLMALGAVAAAPAQDIELVAPSREGGATVMEAFWQRHSEREFAPEALTPQDLSDLMFAASGINRPESAHITAPSAMNKQEIDLYAFTPEGVYLYDKAAHKLAKKADGDHRDKVAGFQEFVKTAPLVIVLVANLDRLGQYDTYSTTIVSIDAGIMAENINLFCTGRGLASVPRTLMNSKEISSRLGLSDTELPIMNVVVGYPKNTNK